MTDLTDEEIAARVQRSDGEAFGLLLERYEPKITRYARRFLLAQADAKDAVQDVFLKAYENIQAFDARRRFSPWLYRIAHNEFVNIIRKRSSGPRFLEFDADTILPALFARETSDGPANESELRKMLEGGLDRVGAKYREPLVLFYYEELNYQEIADVLRIPVSTVGVRLARGRTELRKLFTAEGHNPLR